MKLHAYYSCKTGTKTVAVLVGAFDEIPESFIQPVNCQCNLKELKTEISEDVPVFVKRGYCELTLEKIRECV